MTRALADPGYFLSPLAAATVTIALIVLVLQGAHQDRSRRVFLLALISLELWALFTFGMRTSRSMAAALLWDRLLAAALLGLFVTYFHFCHLYVGSVKRRPIVLLYSLAIPTVALILFTDLAVAGMARADYGYAPEMGPAGLIIFGAVHGLMGVNLVRLLRARRHFAGKDQRCRYLVLSVVGLLPLLGSVADGFTDLPPVAIWTNLSFCTVCTVAVLRYRLFDLRVLARRGLVNLLVSLFVATPYVGAVILANNFLQDRTALLWIYLIAMFAFALILWPMLELVRRLVDRLLRRERYDLLESVRLLARETDVQAGLQEVGMELTELVRRALNAEKVALLQAERDDQDLLVSAATDFSGQPPEDGIALSSPLIRFLQKRRATLRARSLFVEPALQNIPQSERRLLEGLDSTLLAPLISPRGRLSGLLVVGPKNTRRTYSMEDVQLLDSLGAEAALALENARLYRDAFRARETLHAWLNNLPDAVLIVDGERMIRFLNREGEHRFGPRSGQSFLQQQHSGNGAPQRFTETIQGREYEIASAPLVDPEGGLSTVYVLRDISNRREEQIQREQLETKARLASRLASVGAMASGIAHEINNPLTAVIGYSELLNSHALPEETREAVEQIRQGANRVAAIVRRLLIFARQQRAQRSTVDLNEVIRSTLDLRAYALRTENIQVSAVLDPQLPRTVADGQQLQQVLLNLIINAEIALREASRAGEIKVISSCQNEIITIRVRDDGPGIPVEIQDRIFDPFFTTRDVGQGTGLGLSICHGIISEHSGKISVLSQPGDGTEFTVEIPVALDHAAHNGGLSENEEPEFTAQTRILVVDDEQAVQNLLVKILEAEGHQVDKVCDGRIAIDLMKEHRYGLILMDVRMPGMNGIQVYEQARKIAESITSRFIFMTGDVMATEIQDFIEEHGIPVLTKPFGARMVSETIAEVLKENPEPED